MSFSTSFKIAVSVVLDERIDIDREVENVKSVWQMLRGEKDWTKGRDRVDNDRTKKLYETLEKMTCEIDRVQKSYMGSRANRYLRKSATNILRKSGSRPSLQEEAEIVRGVIFPGSKARTKSAAPRLRSVDSEVIGTDVARVRFDEENISTSKSRKGLPSPKKRSVHTNVNEDIADDARSVHTTTPNTRDKIRDPTVADTAEPALAEKWQEKDKKVQTRIKSSIEECLQRYCGDSIHKSRGIEEERSRAVTPSANVIADILASHNIGSHENLYENFGELSDGYDSDDYTSENDEDYSCSNPALNVTKVASADTIRELRRIRSNTSFENTRLYNTRLTKAIDARSFDTRRPSSVTNLQDNTFVRMGLNKKLSKDMLSQILQSEYLKKDLSL